MRNQNGNSSAVAAGVISFIILVILVMLFYVWPQYRVWQQGLRGQADLARATQLRQIRVQAAIAEREAAEETAEAIAILGQAAKDFPEYRQQEFMAAFAEALREGNISQIMYIPTEANIPITEAGKRPPR